LFDQDALESLQKNVFRKTWIAPTTSTFWGDGWPV